jgi:hypothetical protein
MPAGGSTMAAGAFLSVPDLAPGWSNQPSGNRTHLQALLPEDIECANGMLEAKYGERQHLPAAWEAQTDSDWLLASKLAC